MAATILLIDDTNFTRKAVHKILSREFLVHAIADWSQANQYLFQKDGVDLVLMDVEMPGVNGDKIAQGDFDTKIDVDRHDEIGSLGQSVSHMVDSILEVNRQVNTAIQELDQSTTEIASMANEQEQSISEISSSVTQVSSSIQEMNANAVQTEQRAKNVLQSSQDSRETSKHSQKVVDKTLKSMNTIKLRVEQGLYFSQKPNRTSGRSRPGTGSTSKGKPSRTARSSGDFRTRRPGNRLCPGPGPGGTGDRV